MPSTVLAVEDSVTMRRVLEITFAGPDFNVVTVDSIDAALQKLKSVKADVVVADVTLGQQVSGYDLCKAIKQSTPGVPVLILSSKQNPFDPARGSAVQADDHIDKPFDTQQMIDKVKKLLGGGKADAVPAATATTSQTRPAANPLASTLHGTVAPSPNRTMPSGTAPAVAQPQPGAPAPQQRAKTLVYNPGVAMPPIAAAQPARALAPSGRIPATAPAATAPATRPTSVSGSSAATSPSLPATHPNQGLASGSDGTAAHINGQMTAKLEELGLTAHQIEAVVALSREVVERVVWEVVPVLAETIIKEELARITK